MADIQQSLDAMQKTLNHVLVEVGKAFKNQKRDAKMASHPYVRAQEVIPKLDNRFHNALDDIEEEITRAKAVLLRDLEQLRAKRIAAEPKPDPAPSPEKPPEALPEEIPSAPISMMDTKKEESLSRRGSLFRFGGDGTTDTLDRLQKSVVDAQKTLRAPNAASKESAKETGNTFNQTPKQSNRILPNDSLFESPAPSKDHTEKVQEESKKPEPVERKAQNAVDSNKQDPEPVELSMPKANPSTTQANESTDIDSLFDDNNANTNQNDNLDFADIDFTAGGDDFNFAAATAATANNTDLDSLMPQIESYPAVDQSGDFNMLDFTDNTKDNGNANTDAAIDSLFDFPTENNAGSGSIGAGPQSNNVDLGISTESNFDDLLDGMDFGDADDGTGGGSMEHGEFDDAFFGLS